MAGRQPTTPIARETASPPLSRPAGSMKSTRRGTAHTHRAADELRWERTSLSSTKVSEGVCTTPSVSEEFLGIVRDEGEFGRLFSRGPFDADARAVGFGAYATTRDEDGKASRMTGV